MSDLPEIAKVVRENEVGIIVQDHQPQTIANAINRLLKDDQLLQRLKRNTIAASEKYCWENEEMVLRKIYLDEQ